ncbi:MAG: TIM barrel protein [Bryobacteraceae bacterium]
MANYQDRFRFAAAPVSWGVEDYYGPSWDQPYERILNEMVEGGYTATELGPYGYFPTDADTLRPVLRARSLEMLSSFVPANLADPTAAREATKQIRKVGSLLAALEAGYVILADAQSKERENIAGRVPSDGGASLTAEQWKNVARIAREAEQIAGDFGLDLVFHPHVGTFVETPEEMDRFFEALSATRIGLCLDTGHCYYGGGDPVAIASQYRDLLRYVHIKDIDATVLEESKRKKLSFDQAVEAGVFSQIGEGCIDFPAFFRALDENGYAGWCVVEQDIKFGVSAVAPKVSMEASLRYLHGVIETLNTNKVPNSMPEIRPGSDPASR